MLHCAHIFLGEDSEYFNLINKILNDVELLTAFKKMLFDGTQAEISASDFKKIIDRFVSENGSIDYSVKPATQGSSVKPIDRNILQKQETGLLEMILIVFVLLSALFKIQVNSKSRVFIKSYVIFP